MTTDSNFASINRVFDWFNSLNDSSSVVTREDVERLFTPDMKMVANNQVKCVGIDAHYRHFREIRNKLKSWHVRRPFEIASTTASGWPPTTSSSTWPRTAQAV